MTNLNLHSNYPVSFYQDHCPAGFEPSVYPHQTMCPTLSEMQQKWGIADLSSYKPNFFSRIVQWIQQYRNCPSINEYSELLYPQDSFLPFVPFYILDHNQQYETAPYYSKRPEYYHKVSLELRELCYPNAHRFNLAYEGHAAQFIENVVRNKVDLSHSKTEIVKQILSELKINSNSFEGNQELLDTLSQLSNQLLMLSLVTNLQSKEQKITLDALENLGFDFDILATLKSNKEINEVVNFENIVNDDFLATLWTINTAFKSMNLLLYSIFTSQPDLANSIPSYMRSESATDKMQEAIQRLIASFVQRNPNFSNPFLKAIITQDDETAIRLIENNQYIPHELRNNFKKILDNLEARSTKDQNNKVPITEKALALFDPRGETAQAPSFTKTLSNTPLLDKVLESLFDKTTLSEASEPLINILSSPPLQALCSGSSDKVLEALILHHSFDQIEASLFIVISFLSGKIGLMDKILNSRPQIFDLFKQGLLQGKVAAKESAVEIRKVLRQLSLDETSSSSSAFYKTITLEDRTTLTFLSMSLKSIEPFLEPSELLSSIIDMLPESKLKLKMIEIENMIKAHEEDQTHQNKQALLK